MAITKFLQPEFTRVIQELIDTTFGDFSKGLVNAFSRYNKTCKMHSYISYRSNDRFISLVVETQAFNSISLFNSRKSSEMLLFILLLHI